MGYSPGIIKPYQFWGSVTDDGSEYVLPRSFSQQWPTLTSGTLRLSYLTAQKTASVTKLQIDTGGTAAGATPTLVRLGMWLEDPATRDLTLVASVPNTTSLMGGTWVTYRPSVSAAYTKQAGSRYALGVLVVSAAAMPNTFGVTNLNNNLLDKHPRLGASLSGQADLPSSIPFASLSIAAPIQIGALTS